MADVAASVLARLKNKAAKSGRSYQLCLQLFCQEEFLRRLEKSKYAENLVLKGGLFLYSLTDFDNAGRSCVGFSHAFPQYFPPGDCFRRFHVVCSGRLNCEAAALHLLQQMG